MSARLVATRSRQVRQEGSSGERLPPVYPDLAGKRVLVTGASRGIGSAIARAFAAEGCKLVLQFNRNRDAMMAVADEINDLASGLRVFPCDFADSESVERFADTALRAYGGLDIVINNATAVLAGVPSDPTFEALEDCVVGALQAPHLLSTRAAEQMHRQRVRGSILNVTAVPAEASSSRLALHGLTKSALERMSRSMAEAYAEDGIRFNTLSPGLQLGRDSVAVAGLNDDDLTVLAEAALHLASGHSTSLSGLSLSVDDVGGDIDELYFG